MWSTICEAQREGDRAWDTIKSVILQRRLVSIPIQCMGGLRNRLFIDRKRSEGRALYAIFNVLEDHFEPRSFPEDMQGDTPLDLDLIRRKFSEDLRKVMLEEQQPTLERIEQLEKAILYFL